MAAHTAGHNQEPWAQTGRSRAMYGRHREAQNQTTASTSSVIARGTGSELGVRQDQGIT